MRTALLLLLSVALLASGCKQDPYSLIERSDAQVAPPAELGVPTETGPREARADLRPDGACVVDPAGEVCDGLDNDCNGTIDDVPATKLQSDPKNCGACAKACSLTNAFAKCENAKCLIDSCSPGHWDLNKKPDDGCEYNCLVSNGGVEACDDADNNCDGKIDEAFDKGLDPENCSACGTRCLFNHAKGVCQAGICTMGACEDGYADLNKSDKDGCEYSCPVWPPAATDITCDNVDDNCDGQADEGFVGLSCGSSTGSCLPGVSQCQGGNVVCVGGTGPKPESCNSADDDCDGVVDNGYDKQNDPRYCGSCSACVAQHAIPRCLLGVCGIAVCESGWVDLNKNASDGCEYHCTITGPEICDGLDNDCDGLVDQTDPGMVALGGNPCATVGACAGAGASCQGQNGWVCGYGTGVELRPCFTAADCGGAPCVLGYCPGLVASDESRCDGVDNDCDGLVDETFPDKGKPCAEAGKKGICQGTGSNACLPAGTGTFCNITAPGLTAKDELCNGKDDDCDGLVDEEADDAAGKGVKDAMVHVVRAGQDFWVYSYEAARPDATTLAAGISVTRACSSYNVLPWSNATYAEATAACAASGKRLCSRDEWLVACRGPSTTDYPYGSTYQGSSCNGLDNAQNKAVPTGSKTTCASTDGIFDLSGNLKEWTADPRSDGTPPDPDGYTVRGGAYDNASVGLRCDFTFAVMPATFYFPNLGFRCCSNTAP